MNRIRIAKRLDDTIRNTMHFYEPSKGHGLPHDPFNAIVGPRPIGWISSLGEDGIANLAPYSFFNAFTYHPPSIGFSSTSPKDSYRNIAATGEFAWNLVTRPLAEAMNASSATVSASVDEFTLAGVTPAASRLIRAPRVAQSPVSFECRLSQIVQLQSAAGEKTDAWLVLGEVVGIHIAPWTLVDGIYDTAAAGHVLRGGGAAEYFNIGPEQRFRMKRPA